MPLSVNELQALAESHVLQEVNDVTFQKVPMLNTMLRENAVDFRGGDRLEYPIGHDHNDAQWWTGAQTLKTDTKSKRQRARLEWRDVAVPFKLEQTDLEKNNGPDAIIDLIQEEKRSAKKAMKKALAEAIYEGTGDTPSNSTAPRLEGWESILGTGTYATIDPTSDIADSNDWQAFVDSSTNTLDLNSINNAWTETGKELQSMVTHIFFQPAVWHKLWTLLQGSEQFNDTDSDAPVGFSGFRWNGQSEMIMDPFVPGSGGGSDDDHMLFLTLDEDHTKLWVHQDVRMKMTDFKEPVNQKVLVAFIRFKGQLATKQRKAHGVMDSIDPDK